MMYRIKLTAQARKELKTIKSLHQNAMYTAIEEMRENPFLGKALKRELQGKYSYRVGPYRIIYTVNKKDKRVYILTAGHRATVYK